MTSSPARPEHAATESDATFDVREFARTARGSHRGDPALTALAGTDLPADAVHLVRVLRDLERGTLGRMRNLLVTATHKDARVTAFLTTWAFEKFWIADALDAVLASAGESMQGPAADGRRRRPPRERAERRGPILRAIVGNLEGVDVVAAHVTTGLVDEWITRAAYLRLGSLAAPLERLAELVSGIKDRHIAFLAEEAERRLANRERARRLTRTAVARAAWPAGAADRPAADRSFFESIVFGDAAGRDEARAIGDRLARLPGLAGVGPTVAARLAP